MENFLEKIGALKLEELRSSPTGDALASLRMSLTPADGRFLTALNKSSNGAAIIAEFKPASPSAGVINDKVAVDEIVAAYADATAISVLTDSNYFGGSFDLLAAVRQATDKPLLCKDFIISSYQVYRARQSGADAVLLIVKMLAPALLTDLYDEIISLGMLPVVEVQSEEELKVAEALNCDVILINNRNLETLEMDLTTTKRLAPLVQNAGHVIAASGIENQDDIATLAQFARLFLIGSALMKSASPAQRLHELLDRANQAVSEKKRSSTAQIKFCGFQRLEDAEFAVSLGVDFIGLIFAEESPRKITFEAAEVICSTLKNKVKLVGVFRNTAVEQVNAISTRLNLDLVQYHGDESPEQCRLTDLPVIKAFTLTEDFDISKLSQYSDCAKYYLFDRSKGGAANDNWLADALAKLASVRVERPYFLAGGVNETNVATVLESINPFAIDVASSIETSPAIKDRNKMKGFIEATQKSKVRASQGVQL